MTDPAGLLDLRHDERLHQSETLYLTMRGDSPKADLIVEDVELGWRGRRFYVASVERRREASGILLDVEAPALWNRLADRRYVGTFTLFGVTTSAGLEAIVSATGWTVGELDAAIADDVTTFFLEATDATYLDLLRRWAKITDLELEFDTQRRRVRLVSQVGADRTSTGFRYGRNVLNIERKSQPPLATRLYAYGAQGLDITGQTPTRVPYVEDFTYYTGQGISLAVARERYTRELVWKDDAFTTDEALYAAAVSKLAELAAGQTYYRLDVVDLSQLTGLEEDTFAVGDRVRVTDTDLGVDVETRVVRIVRTPLDPAGGEVELSTLDVVVPDGTSAGERSSPFEWELFADLDTSIERRIRNGSTILSRLDLTTVPGAEWVYGFSLVGVGVGTGSISATALDTVSGALLHPVIVRDVADGEPFELAFTAGEKDLPAAERSLVVRAQSSGTGVGADVESRGLAFWVLARGTTQREVVLPESERFDYTGAVQTFTVPDDVTELAITCAGGAGGGSTADDVSNRGGSGGGLGGIVSAKFSVTPGQVFDVYVGGGGGRIGNGAEGWPNGGRGASNGASGDGGGGGGASYVVPTGGAITSALLVAAGGGGSADQGTSRPAADAAGGGGGFYAGGNGNPLSSAYLDSGGKGASQDTGGGAGGTIAAEPTVGETGNTDGQGFGGDAGNDGTGGFFAFPAGGGGGGYHGGGGGLGNRLLGGGHYGGDGGGGCGYLDPNGWDLEFTDAANGNATSWDGYVEIEWETPA